MSLLDSVRRFAALAARNHAQHGNLLTALIVIGKRAGGSTGANARGGAGECPYGHIYGLHSFDSEPPAARLATLRGLAKGATAAVFIGETDDGVIVTGETARERVTLFAPVANGALSEFRSGRVILPGCEGFLMRGDA